MKEIKKWRKKVLNESVEQGMNESSDEAQIFWKRWEKNTSQYEGYSATKYNVKRR